MELLRPLKEITEKRLSELRRVTAEIIFQNLDNFNTVWKDRIHTFLKKIDLELLYKKMDEWKQRRIKRWKKLKEK